MQTLQDENSLDPQMGAALCLALLAKCGRSTVLGRV